MHQHLSDTAKHWLDGIAILLGGVTVASFLSQLALIVTIVAGLGSISLVALRWHDRIRFGPDK